MNVLVIPEDFRKDQYILKPLFERLLASLGRRRAKVRVCQDPLLGGVGEALKRERIAEIVARYEGMTHVFVLCIDRDGDEGRRQRLDGLEAEFGDGRTFVAENAWEELETWVLAGLDLRRDWNWADVRAERRQGTVLRCPGKGPRGGRRPRRRPQGAGGRGSASDPPDPSEVRRGFRSSVPASGSGTRPGSTGPRSALKLANGAHASPTPPPGVRRPGGDRHGEAAMMLRGRVSRTGRSRIGPQPGRPP